MKKILITLITAAIIAVYGINGYDQKNLDKLLQTKQCPNCSLIGITIKGVNLDNANLEGANLQGATFSIKPGAKQDWEMNLYDLETTLRNANLKNTDLRGTTFYKVNLSGADLSGAKFDKKTKFDSCWLINTKISKKALKNAGVNLGLGDRYDYYNVDKDAPKTSAVKKN